LYIDVLLFLAQFNEQLPSSKVSKAWIDAGKDKFQQDNRTRKIFWRDQYAAFQRYFLAPINNYVTKSNGGFRCIDANKQAIVTEAFTYVHSMFFGGKSSFYFSDGQQVTTTDTEFPDVDKMVSKGLTYLQNSGYCHNNYLAKLLKKSSNNDKNNINQEEVENKPPISRYIFILSLLLFFY
jgi:hypothetical protein